MVSGAVLLAAWERSRGDVVTGAVLVLALYALTAVVDGEPATVSVVLSAALDG